MIRIGSDETLKGDSFGGLVIVAVMCDDAQREKLKQMGVDDSKKIKDNMIPFLAKRIREVVPFAVAEKMPAEYNQGTLTQMMNDMHLACATELRKTVPESIPVTHIVDLYPGCKVGDVAETKAESKYVEVAAASIIARDVGLKQFDKLSADIGFALPKGSTHVAEALARLKADGREPKNFVKLHFKNVQKALF